MKKTSVLSILFFILLLSCSIITAQTNEGWTSLQIAVLKGEKEQVAALLHEGANINTTTNTGSTPLHIAAYKEHKQIAAMLIKEGANIEAKNMHGQTALHVATTAKHINMIRLLLKWGADIEAKDKNGETSLHVAMAANNLEIGKLLLDNGANIHATDKNGTTGIEKTVAAGVNRLKTGVQDLFKQIGDKMEEAETIALKTEQERTGKIPVSDILWETMYNERKGKTELQQNELWKKYSGKKVRWSGSVSSVRESYGNLLLEIDNESSIAAVRIILYKDERQKALAVQLGQNVTITGIINSWKNESPIVLTNGQIINHE